MAADTQRSALAAAWLVVLAGFVGGLIARVVRVEIAARRGLDLDHALAGRVGEVGYPVCAHALGVLEIPGLDRGLLRRAQRRGRQQRLPGMCGPLVPR